MQEILYKKRRNLLLIAAVSIFLCYAKVSISGLTLNGLALVTVGKEGAVGNALSVLLLYSFMSFFWCAIDYGDKNFKAHFDGVYGDYLKIYIVNHIVFWTAKENSFGSMKTFSRLKDEYSELFKNEKNLNQINYVIEKVDSATRRGARSVMLDKLTKPSLVYLKPGVKFYRAKIRSGFHILTRTSLFIDYVVPFLAAVIAMWLLFEQGPIDTSLEIELKTEHLSETVK